MKACPYCAEEIQDAAIVCKHCGRELPVPTGAATTDDSNGSKCSACGHVNGRHRSTCSQCQSPLTPKPGAPTTAAQPRRISSVWLVVAVISFGAMFIPGSTGAIGTLVAIVAMGKSMTAKSRIVRYGTSFFLCLFMLGFIRSTLQEPPAARHATVETPQTPASPTTTTPPRRPEPPRPTSKWRGGEGAASAMDGSPSVVFSLDAENQVRGWLKSERPRLFARCSENRTDVIFRASLPFQPVLGEYEKASIRVRWDDSAPTSSMWGESTDSEAVFAPSPIPFMRRMASAERLRVEFTPFNSNPAVVEFDVRGFADKIGLVAKTCGWNP